MEEGNNKIQPNLINDFERELREASFTNLSDKSNKLRFNNFAYSLRELSRHILKRLSPDDEVLKCQWYKNLIENRENGITRSQRVKYAVQGGISDQYITNTLGIDVAKLNKEWKKTIDRLSKYTHVNPDSFNLPDEKVNEYSQSACDCFESLFLQINDSRKLILEKLREHLMPRVYKEFLIEYNKKVKKPYSVWVPLTFEAKDIAIQSIDSNKIQFKSFGIAHAAKLSDLNKRKSSNLYIDMVHYLSEFHVLTDDLSNPVAKIDNIILNNGDEEIPDKLLDAMIDNEIE